MVGNVFLLLNEDIERNNIQKKRIDFYIVTTKFFKKTKKTQKKSVFCDLFIHSSKKFS